MDAIQVTLNGTKVSARPGMTILELARENGMDIPTLCYLPELTPIGVCRICVVEVEGARTLVASCHTPVTANMVIHTHSPKVVEARKVIVELLLAGHPDVCLVCDKANTCELRKIAADLEVSPRFRGKRRYNPLEEVSPYLVRDLDKCILCRRCVRACHEIKKADVFDVAYRGSDSKITVDLDQPLDKNVCQSCDVCVSVCPVGALTKREERFKRKKGPPLTIKAQPDRRSSDIG